MASLADELAAADNNMRSAGDWHEPADSKLRRVVHKEVVPILKDYERAKKIAQQMTENSKAHRAWITEREKEDEAKAKKMAARWKKVDALTSKPLPRANQQLLEHELRIAKDELANLREQAAQPDTGPSKARLNMQLEHCNSRVEWLKERNAKLEKDIDDVLDESTSRVRALNMRNAQLKKDIEAEYDNDANKREAELHINRKKVEDLKAQNSVLKKQAARYKSDLAAYDDPIVPEEAKQFLAGY